MTRLIDFALLAFLAWFLWSQILRGWRQASSAAGPGRAESRQTPRNPDSAVAMTLVRCDACGVHVPAARTLPGPGGKVFCSEACRGLESRPR